MFSRKKMFPKTPDFSVKIFKRCDNEWLQEKAYMRQELHLVRKDH
jgi:hypothetical protein